MGWIDDIPDQTRDFGQMTDAAESALDYVNAQLSLRGTLQVDSIDLAELAEASRKVLKDVAHIQGYRGAVYAAIAQADADGFETALRITLRLFSQDWTLMHPTAQKAARLKSSATKDIYETVAKAAKSLPGRAFDLTETHSQIAKELHKVLAQSGGFDAAPFELEEVAPKTTALAQDKPQTTASKQSFLDARGRVELRQDILKLAERIAGFEPDAQVAATLRGYAAWMEHRTAPEYDEDGKTEITTLPRKLRDDLLSAVQMPSYEGLARLEERLVHSPDWFEGQMAASQVAKALGLEKFAQAIKERVRDRLSELPVLNELAYQNGDPFLPNEVQAWLNQGALVRATDGQEPELEAQAAEGVSSLEEVLERLNADLCDANSPRQRAVLRLGASQQLLARGQADVAASLIDGALAQTKTLTVPEWDSSLFEQLKTISDEQGK